MWFVMLEMVHLGALRLNTQQPIKPSGCRLQAYKQDFYISII